MTRLALALATAGGAGLFPFAPGTVGAAVGVLLYVAVRPWSVGVEIATVAIVSVVGVWAAAVAARHFDREDPGQVVIDEVAGQLVTYLFLDVGWVGLIWGFLLFRVFDIIKPWPAGRLEHLPGGWGVMADDLMAGAYAWIVLALSLRFVPIFR
jgi:phosphatidylglycerophosphatase A